MLSRRSLAGIALIPVVTGALLVAGSVMPRQGRSSTIQRWNGRIVYATSNGLTSMNGDGSGKVGGAAILPGDTAPAWSSDGTQLAVVQNWQGVSGIRLDRPDGRQVRLLTTDPQDSAPAWSPDGSRIAFTREGGLATLTLEGGGLVKLAVDALVKARPSWSPDGSHIAFQASDASSDTPGIWMVDLASGTETRMTTSPAGDYAPAWSPAATTSPSHAGRRISRRSGSSMRTGRARLASASARSRPGHRTARRSRSSRRETSGRWRGTAATGGG
ncbi:MAG: TolB protein [Gaiellales bacterium]|nr:TolB protein [Gaiellales bacterium]